MIQMVKKQMQVQWRDWLWEFAVLLVVWLIGFCMLHVIMADDGGAYMALGTGMAGIIVGITSLLTGIFSVGIHFNVQVAMGCTRKNFFFSYYIVNCIMNLLLVLLLILLCITEIRFCKVIYPGVEQEVNLLPWLIKAGIPAALAISAAGGLCGALVLHFGKKAFWVLWFLWMFVFLGIPRITDAVEEAPQSFFGMLGRQASLIVQAVPGNVWIAAGTAGVLLCLGGSWMVLRKQQITL